jgi:hypothetical protein
MEMTRFLRYLHFVDADRLSTPNLGADYSDTRLCLSSVLHSSRDGPASSEWRVSDGAAHMRVARHGEEVKGVDSNTRWQVGVQRTENYSAI